MVVQPMQVLGINDKQNMQEEGNEVLIQWKGSLDSEATWEDYQTINIQFADFHLEDKVSLLAGSNVMNQEGEPQLRFTYARKGTRRTKQR